MSKPAERRELTADEMAAAKCLQGVSMAVASWDKRFYRNCSPLWLQGSGITDKEAPQLWRLFIRYRRQFNHPDKARLLALAETLSAPDLRKQAATDRERQEIEARYKQSMNL